MFVFCKLSTYISVCQQDTMAGFSLSIIFIISGIKTNAVVCRRPGILIFASVQYS